jgi:hypothetical protein
MAQQINIPTFATGITGLAFEDGFAGKGGMSFRVTAGATGVEYYTPQAVTVVTPLQESGGVISLIGLSSIGPARSVVAVNAGASALEYVSSTGSGDIVRATAPTISTEATILGANNSSAILKLYADLGNDNGDQWLIAATESDGGLSFQNKATGSFVTYLNISSNGYLTFNDLLVTNNGVIQGSLEASGVINLGNAGDLRKTFYIDSSVVYIGEAGTPADLEVFGDLTVGGSVTAGGATFAGTTTTNDLEVGGLIALANIATAGGVELDTVTNAPSGTASSASKFFIIDQGGSQYIVPGYLYAP